MHMYNQTYSQILFFPLLLIHPMSWHLNLCVSYYFRKSFQFVCFECTTTNSVCVSLRLITWKSAPVSVTVVEPPASIILCNQLLYLHTANRRCRFLQHPPAQHPGRGKQCEVSQWPCGEQELGPGGSHETSRTAAATGESVSTDERPHSPETE